VQARSVYLYIFGRPQATWLLP